MENDIKKLEKLLSEKEAEVESIKYQIDYIKRATDPSNLVGKCIKTDRGKYIKVKKVKRLPVVSNVIALKGKAIMIKQTDDVIQYVLDNNDFVIYNDNYMTVISESEFNEVLEKAIKAMRD